MKTTTKLERTQRAEMFANAYAGLAALANVVVNHHSAQLYNTVGKPVDVRYWRALSELSRGTARNAGFTGEWPSGVGGKVPRSFDAILTAAYRDATHLREWCETRGIYVGTGYEKVIVTARVETGAPEYHCPECGHGLIGDVEPDGTCGATRCRAAAAGGFPVMTCHQGDRDEPPHYDPDGDDDFDPERDPELEAERDAQGETAEAAEARFRAMGIPVLECETRTVEIARYTGDTTRALVHVFDARTVTEAISFADVGAACTYHRACHCGGCWVSTSPLRDVPKPPCPKEPKAHHCDACGAYFDEYVNHGDGFDRCPICGTN
jgi:hypothetical protein